MLTDDDMKQLTPWQRNVAGLLTVMAGIDGRDVTPLMVVSWADLLVDERRLTPEDCREAIRRHYKTQTRRMWPADLVSGAKELRRERAKEQERGQLVEIRKKEPIPAEVRAQLAAIKRVERT